MFFLAFLRVHDMKKNASHLVSDLLLAISAKKKHTVTSRVA